MDWSALVALASGIPLLAFGIFLVVMRPVSSPSLFFGLYSILWGVQIVAANVGIVMDRVDVLRAGLFVSYGLLSVMVLYMGRFISLVGPKQWRRPIMAVSGLASIVAAAIVVLRPSWVLEEVGRSSSGALRVAAGPAVVPAFAIPTFGILVFGVWVLHRRLRAATMPLHRRRLQGLIAALLFYLSYASIYNGAVFFDAIRNTGGSIAASAWTLYAMFALFVVTLMATAWIVAAVVRQPDVGPRRSLILAAFLVPAAAASIEAVIRLNSQTDTFSTIGIWRIAMVATLAYSLARDQLFDIDLKVRWTFKQGAAGAVLAAGFFVAKEALELVVPGEGMSVNLMAAVGATVAFYPVQRGVTKATSRVFGEEDQLEEQLDIRKAEVFQIALETAYEDGEITDREQKVLDVLRRQLGLSTGAAKSLHNVVRDRANLV